MVCALFLSTFIGSEQKRIKQGDPEKNRAPLENDEAKTYAFAFLRAAITLPIAISFSSGITQSSYILVKNMQKTEKKYFHGNFHEWKFYLLQYH